MHDFAYAMENLQEQGFCAERAIPILMETESLESHLLELRSAIYIETQRLAGAKGSLAKTRTEYEECKANLEALRKKFGGTVMLEYLMNTMAKSDSPIIKKWAYDLVYDTNKRSDAPEI